MDNTTGDEPACINSLTKSKQLKNYSWNSESTNYSPLCPNVLSDLLKAEIISGKELLNIKEQNLIITYNPKVLMDLRHEEVKRHRQSSNNVISKHDVREEAKRFIQNEDQKVILHKKEQTLIDKEIGTLKQQLNKIRIMIKQESRHQTLPRSRNEITKQYDSYCCNEYKDTDVFHAENIPDFQVKCRDTSNVALLQTESKKHSATNDKNKMNVMSQEGQRFAHVRSSVLETESRDLLAKYWHQWRMCMRHRHNHHYIRHSETVINSEKIERFIKSLHEKKMQVQNCSKEKSYSKHRISILQPQMKMKHKLDNMMESDAHLKSKNSNNVYEHRLKTKTNIIAVQKAEIEKQNQLIEELKLAKLKLEAEKSCAEASNNLRTARSSCDISLKAKANALVHGLSVLSKDDTVPRNDSFAIILRMEERNRERKRRWQLIKEKRKLMEEEKQNKLLKEEAERKLKEDEEKMCKIMMLREKRRLEKENELKRQKEREKMQESLGKARNHYHRYLLLKYGLGGWVALIALRECQLEHAVCHYNTKLLQQHFYKWREFTQQSVASKLNVATAHYQHKLLQHCFHHLLMVYDDGIRNIQVAADFYELKLLERLFSYWHQWICRQHVAMAYKHVKASEHAERRLLARCLRWWQQFPSVVQLERERENRKYVWRRKVQEILPDFRPATPV